MKRMKAIQILLLFFFVASFANSVLADVEIEVDGQTGMMSVKIEITPAKEVIPAFKYRLTVEPYKTVPGNAITHYIRSLGEDALDGPLKAASQKFGYNFYDWSSISMPERDVPADKLREACSMFDDYVENYLKRASLCREADWGLAVQDLRGREVIDFRLPSVQQTRSMARILVLKSRLALIDRRFEDSIDNLRMTYQLGQNVNEMGVLVSSLVGMAEIGMANDGMIHFVGAGASPNMYWALSELPRPVLSIRKPMRIDLSNVIRIFPELMDVENAEFSIGKWKRLLVEVTQLIAGIGKTADTDVPMQTELQALRNAMTGYTQAKKRLLDSGMDSKAVTQMPVAQVLLIDAVRDMNYFKGLVEKAIYVPHARVEEFDHKANELIREAAKTRLGAKIVDVLAPATWQVRLYTTQAQADLNMLINIEAIRHHAATTGKLPGKLSELELPTYINPFSGDPFDYELKGDTAVLSVPESNSKRRYEITIAN
jgi:hypothetical protein